MKNNLKNILTQTIILASISMTSQAFAKTEGSYIGLDLIKRSTEVKSNSNSAIDANLPEYYSHKKDDSAYGVGINYKYAFNFNNFFIAPAISYNFINNDIKVGYAGTDNDPYSQSMKLKSQLTLQTNFGYDIHDKFSAYIPVGISSFNYELTTKDVVNEGSVSTKKSGRESAIFFGLGFAYEPVKNWVVNLEYNKFQSLKVSSPTATINRGNIVANT